MPQELVLSALKQAYRKCIPPKGVILHSDRGAQYAATTVREYLQEKGIIQSMSGKGNCYDNAITETFFKTLKAEHVQFEYFQTRKQAKISIFEYIEVFYNKERRHSALGYLSPANFEKDFLEKVASLCLLYQGNSIPLTPVNRSNLTSCQSR